MADRDLRDQHRCLPVCHPCPRMRDKDEIMPMCWNGVLTGEMEGCLCFAAPLHRSCGHCRHGRGLVGADAHEDASRRAVDAALGDTDE